MSSWISVVLAMATVSVVVGVAAPFVPDKWWDSRKWQAVCGGSLLAFGALWFLVQVWH